MEIKEAIELIWNNKKYESQSVIEVLSHLNEEVAESLKALLKNDEQKAQEELEDALSCMLIAIKILNINPEDAIQRQIDRMQSSLEKTMHIFSDRVEIRVGNQVKGGWTLWSTDDLAEAFKVAQEFKCKVIHEDTTLFSQIIETELETNNAG